MVVIFTLVIIWTAGEVIGFIVFARFVDEFVGVFCQTRDITGNTAIDFVWLSVILKVGMISEDQDFVGCAK
jgi:hypothetical protein